MHIQKIKSSSGFTIVEIVIVIVVIAILTTISVLAFGTQRQQSRDSQRQARATVIAEALEKYYDENGEYPSCTAVTADANSVAGSVLVGIDASALVAPQDSPTDANSLSCTDLTALTQSDYFAYVGDGSANCLTGNACLGFTIKYKDEVSGQIATIESRRKVDINTSGAMGLTAVATGFDTVSLNWNQLPNTLNYTVERATNSGFTTNLVAQQYTGANATVSGLSMNTTYHFRIRANSATGVTNWANNVATTWNLAAPTLTTSGLTSTGFQANWNTVANAAGYKAQCSTNGTTWNSTCESSVITQLNYAFSGKNQGARYWVRAQAVNGSFTSAWSNVAQVVTTIDTPAAVTASISTSGSVTTYSRTNATCPTGTTAYYQRTAWQEAWNSGWVDEQATSWGWDTSPQGYNYRGNFRARCYTAETTSGYSAASNEVSYVRPVSTPSFGPWSKVNYDAYEIDIYRILSCGSGLIGRGRADIYTYDVNYSRPTNKTGWWAYAGNSYTWVSDWYNITANSGNVFGLSWAISAGARSTSPLPGTARYQATVEAKCVNQTTGVESAVISGGTSQIFTVN